MKIRPKKYLKKKSGPLGKIGEKFLKNGKRDAPFSKILQYEKVVLLGFSFSIFGALRKVSKTSKNPPFLGQPSAW